MTKESTLQKFAEKYSICQRPDETDQEFFERKTKGDKMKRYKLVIPETISKADALLFSINFDLLKDKDGKELPQDFIDVFNDIPKDWLEEVEPEIDWSQVANQSPIEFTNESNQVLQATFVEVLKRDRVLVIFDGDLRVLHVTQIQYPKHFAGGREAWLKQFMPTIQEVVDESMGEARSCDTCRITINHLSKYCAECRYSSKGKLINWKPKEPKPFETLEAAADAIKDPRFLTDKDFHESVLSKIEEFKP